MNANLFPLRSGLVAAVSLRGLLPVAIAAAIAPSFGPAALSQEPDEAPSARAVREALDGDIRVLTVDVEGHEDTEEDIVTIHMSTGDEDLAEVVQFAGPALSMHRDGGFLGVQLTNINDPLRTHFGVPEGSGVLVSEVVPDSPAARAGIQVGDILTRFDGRDVPDSWRLISMVARTEPGDPANIEIWRDGQVETLSTTLAESPQPDRRRARSFVLRGHEDLNGDGELDAFIGPEDFDFPEMIQEYFDGEEWKERHEHLQRFLHEHRPDMKALEDRLESLKKRLAALEQRIEKRRGDGEED